MRAIVAHDWLVHYGGSERVVQEILQLLPDHRLLTTVARHECLPESLRRAHTSWLQKIPGASERHQWLLPLMPLAWRSLSAGGAECDVVISSSHSCAKAFRAPKGVPHICYCHTPMRYAWDFAAEKNRVPSKVRLPAAAAMAGFRRWDSATAPRVTQFVANSSAVAERIRRSYSRDSVVIHPPVRTDFFKMGLSPREDFYLYVGRLTGYKRPELVVEAFAGSESRLVVVGTGPQTGSLLRQAGANVTFIPKVSDEGLRSLYRRTRAMIFPADEDFGIAMAEAQACGAPVIALNRGGARDIVAHGETGLLIEDQSTIAIRHALKEFERTTFDHALISERADRFSPAHFRRSFGALLVEVFREAA